MSSVKEPGLAGVRQAADRIRPHIRTTPLEPSLALSARSGTELYLKLENWQKTGSFKIRGALNKLLSLSAEERSRGIITASAGNHGLGVAYAANLLDVAGKIVVPENASAAKVSALGQYGLELVKTGRDYDEAEEAAWKLRERENLTFVHAFSDPAVIAGQGTVGLEICVQLPDVATIVVPIGGGGLISGVAIAAKAVCPRVRVVGVQSEASPAMVRALEAGRVVETPIAATVADGLAGRFVTELTLALVRKYVDDVVLVSEASLRDAVRAVLETEHMVIEGSAAAGVAALLAGQVGPGARTAVVLTGRNISPGLLKNIIA